MIRDNPRPASFEDRHLATAKFNIALALVDSILERRKKSNSSGVYVCKSEANYFKHGNYICKSEGMYLTYEHRIEIPVEFTYINQ